MVHLTTDPATTNCCKANPLSLPKCDQPSTTAPEHLNTTNMNTLLPKIDDPCNNKDVPNKAFYKQRSEAKLRQVLGPVSFSLKDQKEHKKSTMSKKPNQLKLREMLGPVSFNLKSDESIE